MHIASCTKMMTDLPGVDNIICQECGLYKQCKSPFMVSSGEDSPTILVIGEAPGDVEDKKGLPFVGRSGKLIRGVLDELGLNDAVRFTNIVRCRPPDNKISKKYIRSCSRFAEAEIDEYNPEYVLLLGNTPLEAILGQSGITQWNGVCVDRDGRKYIPLYHPAYILRNNGVMDEWFEAIIDSVSSEVSTVQRFDRRFPRTLPEIHDMYVELNKYDVISYDIETTSLDPFSNEARIIALSMAGGNVAYAIPMMHKDGWFCEGDIAYIIDNVLKKLLYDKCVVGHNIKFDQKFTKRHLGIEFAAGGDTMLISHLLDSRRGIHSLKRLGGIHVGMYDYDKELHDYISVHCEANPAYGGNYEHVPLHLLLRYAVMDAEATLKLYEKLYDMLSVKQKILHDELIMHASDALSDIEYRGIAMDDYIVRRYAHIYNCVCNNLYDRIVNDKHVIKYIKTRISNDKKYKFNPNSSQQLADVLYGEEYYGLEILGRTDTGLPSTKNAYIKNYSNDYPIVADIVYYKLLSKMLGTYLMPAFRGSWYSDDNRVRTNFNLHGSRTGRLSSSSDTKLNMQNIPTPEKEPGTLLETLPIKNIFTHSYVNNSLVVRNHSDFIVKYRDGAVIVVDYSGMELRIFSSLAKCYPMIDIFNLGKDVHSCVAIMAMTGKTPDNISFDDISRLPKTVRYIYKWTNWTLLYGGGKWTLMSMYGMSEKDAEEVIEKYYNLFPQVLEYGDDCVSFAEKHGYIESPFGRREYLPYINDSSEANKKRRNAARRQAKNMPTQSAASDITLMCSTIVNDKLAEYGYEASIVNTVHDSIVIDSPAHEVAEVSGICVQIMENIKKYAKDYFPHMDMSWIIAPLQANVEVGTHYGSEVELEEWKRYIGLR